MKQDKYTLSQQETTSGQYEENAPMRVVEMEYSQNADGTMNYHTQDGLVLSRTRLEFLGEHYVWANSEYLKSIGNEDSIYVNFCRKQRQG